MPSCFPSIDASERTWKVKKEGQTLTEGWKEFVEAHNLPIGDFVIFRQEGDMLFHVTAFGPSCCEIQYPPSCGHNEDEEESDETDSGKEQSCLVVNVTKGSLKKDRLFLPRSLVTTNILKKETNKIVLMNEGLRKWNFSLKFRESSQSFYIRLGWIRFCDDNGFKPGDSIIFKPERDNTKTPLLRFSTVESKRVPTKT